MLVKALIRKNKIERNLKHIKKLFGELASNPYAFTIKGNTAYIVDAAANDILSVGLDGSNLKTFTVLPQQKITNPIFPTPAPGQELPPDQPSPDRISTGIEIQSVPTGAAFGPDGDLYVSEFTGYPFPVGKARIFRSHQMVTQQSTLMALRNFLVWLSMVLVICILYNMAMNPSGRVFQMVL